VTYKDWAWSVVAGKTGIVFAETGRPKLVLHTTETRGYPNYSWPPHITFSGDANTGVRHVPDRLGAYALRSPGGGFSPNYQAGYVFQMEIIAYAKKTPSYSDDWYRNLAQVCVDVCVANGIPGVFHPSGFAGGGAYGLDGVNRLSWTQFSGFSGILGHQHVPFNTHWDPGKLDVERLDNYMKEITMATYRTVLNVPEDSNGQPKDWAKAVVDWGIASGKIVVSDDHPDDWEAPLNYGAYWTQEYRTRT
jgi:hypothetical protein